MTWKRFFILVLIGLASLLLLNGQESMENTNHQGKSFLWEIQTEHGSSYLLGSVHLLKKEQYPLKKVIEDAFAQSDVLVLEVDLSGEKLLQSAMMMLQKGMYQGEETLQDNLSEKTYQQVKEKLKAMDMDIEGFKKNKPWMVAITVMENKLIRLGFNPTYGIDLYFLKKAEGKKEIQGLETIEFQVSLFDHFSKEEDEKFLLSTILEADQIEKEMGKMITAWSNGDAAALEKIMTENIQEYPELMAFYKKINDDRNVRMVEKIISFLQTGKKYFIVVGAAHMVGKNGIVQLLKDKGYQVNQL
jgi:uncharacterized protein YbaP (TraB family)